MFNITDVTKYRNGLINIFPVIEGYLYYKYKNSCIINKDGFIDIEYFELVHAPSIKMKYIKPEGSPFTIEWNFEIIRKYSNG